MLALQRPQRKLVTHFTPPFGHHPPSLITLSKIVQFLAWYLRLFFCNAPNLPKIDCHCLFNMRRIKKCMIFIWYCSRFFFRYFHPCGRNFSSPRASESLIVIPWIFYYISYAFYQKRAEDGPLGVSCMKCVFE